MATIQQREELHRTIWSMADELRGAIGGWEFKAYVLGTLFYRFISENLTDYINRLQEEAGVSGFNYADMADEDATPAKAQMVQEKGFFILPSQLFQNVCKNCEQDENLNMTLSNIFKEIEASAHPCRWHTSPCRSPQRCFPAFWRWHRRVCCAVAS